MSQYCGDYDIGYQHGAAVAFGLIGMAEAIRRNPNVKACPDCLKFAWGSCTGIPWHPSDEDRVRFLAPGETVCMGCYDKRKANHERANENRNHPYR